ncbi:MAG: hypothetical protein ACRD0K_15615, partial [Egibacteraceae bacterium]
MTSPTVSLAAPLTGDRPPVTGTSAMDLARYTTEIAASGFPAIRATTGRRSRCGCSGSTSRCCWRAGRRRSGQGTAPCSPNLFESLVALSARVFAQAAEAAVGHLRTAGGEHEVDLIIERLD